jgi:hypothetical protein
MSAAALPVIVVFFLVLLSIVGLLVPQIAG